MNAFNKDIQYLVNQGYIVIAPNFRGSTGYGEAFQFANRRDWGGGRLDRALRQTSSPSSSTRTPSSASTTGSTWVIPSRTKRSGRTDHPSTSLIASRPRSSCWPAATIRATPPTEALQVADAIQKRGGVVEIKVYPDEGHSFSKLENQLDAYQRIADFLRKHVPPR